MQLLQYAYWYDSLNQLPASDRPSDEIIEDDAELDRWFDRYMRAASRRGGKSTRASEEEARALVPKYDPNKPRGVQR